MFLFICWWFPRTWARGDALERAEYDEMFRQRRLAAETAGASGDADVELGDGVGKETGVTVAPQPRSTFIPPVTSY